MPSDLRALVNPETTAVLTMELQRGITGDLAAMQQLAEEVRALGVVDNAARLCAGARAVGASVVHCTAAFRPDEQGSAFTSRLSKASRKLINVKSCKSISLYIPYDLARVFLTSEQRRQRPCILR